MKFLWSERHYLGQMPIIASSSVQHFTNSYTLSQYVSLIFFSISKFQSDKEGILC